MPTLTINNIIDIISQFKSSELLIKLSELQIKDNMTLDVDYEWEIEQLKQKIAQQNQEIAEFKRTLEEARLKRCFLPVKEEPEDYFGDLFDAIEYRSLATIQYLIEVEGADPDTVNSSGCTPFWVACEEGNFEIVQYLSERTNANREATDHDGCTPFWIACYMGRLEVVQYLCERRYVNKEAANSIGETPFYAACYMGNLEVVQYLCEKQNIDKVAATCNGETPFYISRGTLREYLESIGVPH